MVTLCATAALMAGPVAVADDETAADAQQMTQEERRAAREAKRQEWEAMSEDERAAARAERKARWENMSEEERQAAMKKRQKKAAMKRKAMREHWDSLSEEERQAIRDRQREHRKAAPAGKGGPGQRAGGPGGTS
jgi:hypothetical protein